METIYKYDLKLQDEFRLKLPKHSTILKIDVLQNGEPKLWALVDTECEDEELVFYCRGTGHDCTDFDAKHYLGTVVLNMGALVFHYFMDPVIMPKCRSCKQEIDWVKLKSGANHPVDPEYIEYDDADVGDKIVTDGGNIITVEENLSYPSIRGRQSHFATCPDADKWRKS